MAGYEERKKIIEELQKLRKSKIISYFTMTDRQNAPNLNIADEAIRVIYQLLEKIGHTEKIDLFIYTRGGAMQSAYQIVKMIREYATEYYVIAPFRVHSAGTQIALGSNGIVMTKTGQLSPIDPFASNLFNPILNPALSPELPQNRKIISVEDVEAYLNLSKNKVGLANEDNSLEVFKELTKFYEPLALGNVTRTNKEARSIAKEVLSFHMDPKTESEKIDRIVKSLTEEYTHGFIVTRDMAEKIGLKVIKPSDDEEKLIMKLYQSYENELKMTVPFDAESVLKGSSSTPSQQAQPSTPLPAGINPINSKKFKILLGVIESCDDSYVWVTDGTVYPSLIEIVPQLITQAGQYPPNPIPNFQIGCWIRTDVVKNEKFV